MLSGYEQLRKKMASYTSAMFQDWEHLGNVIKRGIHQQCFKIGNTSAM